jgi:serine/threonine protein kinase
MSAPRLFQSLSLAGTVLADRYELRAMLGRGGMGEVYEAADPRLDRTVAVKVLLPELAADRRFVGRFHREARTAARLSHPRIVAVHDVGEDDGRVFIVMEFVSGTTLTDVVRTGEPVRAARVARIGTGIAEALAHAHARGIVHRDVAPGNVMLDEADRVKVLDFGIARAARGSGSAAGASVTVHGTIAYAAPEVLSGGLGDQRVDVYGLGAVLYELLTGVPPFRGSSEHHVERRLAIAAPVRPRAWVPSVPVALEAVVLRCLARNPDARPADADRLTDELRRLAAELPSEVTVAPLISDATVPVTPTAPLAGATFASIATAPDPRTRTTPRARGGDTRPLSVDPTDRRRRRGSRATRFVVAAALLAVAAGAGTIVLPPLVALSRPVAVKVRPPDALPPPAGLSGESSCDGWMAAGASISWQAVDGATAYEIWRRGSADADFALVASVDAGTTWFRDSGLGIDATYRYRVRAMDGPLTGAWSTEIEGSTPRVCLT